MILDREHRQMLVPNPFHSLVVEVDVGDLHLLAREGVDVHAEPVILHRDGHIARPKLLYRPDDAFDRLRVAGPVGKHQAIGVQLGNLIGRGRRRHDGYLTSGRLSIHKASCR